MWLLVIVILAFAAGAILGAPFLPVRRPDIEPLLDLVGVGKGHTVVDLGSGDGRILEAVARRGAMAIGYELNPFLWLASIIRTWSYRDRVKIHLANYWHQTLPDCDLIYVFLISRYMSKLDQKLRREATKPVWLISYIYQMPAKKPQAATRNAFLYKY